jgi:hypothetical protein
MRGEALLLSLWLTLLLWSGGEMAFRQADFWQQTNGPEGEQ